MGFLDNVVNGLGQDAAGGLGDLLKSQGGVGGLAEKFGQAGLGDVVGSWVGAGANAGVTAEQIAAQLPRSQRKTLPEDLKALSQNGLASTTPEGRYLRASQ